MQKKLKVSALTMALIMMFTISANAIGIQPRWNVTTSCDPTLIMSGTNAICQAEVWAETGAKITGTMTLYRVSSVNQTMVARWNFSGTRNVFAEESCSVTKGQTYKLVVSVNVSGSNGSDSITVNTTKTC